jgi:hypothetical protein
MLLSSATLSLFVPIDLSCFNDFPDGSLYRSVSMNRFLLCADLPVPAFVGRSGTSCCPITGYRIIFEEACRAFSAVPVLRAPGHKPLSEFDFL